MLDRGPISKRLTKALNHNKYREIKKKEVMSASAPILHFYICTIAFSCSVRGSCFCITAVNVPHRLNSMSGECP